MEPDNGSRGGHTVVCVAAPFSALQLGGANNEPVSGFFRISSQPVDLHNESVEPVGFVSAEVGDAAEFGGGVGAGS